MIAFFVSKHLRTDLSFQQRRPAVARGVWVSIACLLLTLKSAVQCPAFEIRRVQTCSGAVLQLRGDFEEGDFDRLRSQLKRSEKVVGFELSSGGGLFEEGRLIAEFTRHEKLSVFVADECDSACADVFVAAAKRYLAPEARIGVHSVSIDGQMENESSRGLTIGMAKVWTKRGVPHSVVSKMIHTSADAISYLDRDDLVRLAALAYNPFQYRGVGEIKSKKRWQGPGNHCPQ